MIDGNDEAALQRRREPASPQEVEQVLASVRRSNSE
jgi:hypothetical protein